MKMRISTKILAIAFVSLVVGTIIGAECWATQATGKYVGKYDLCLAESGGRDGILSVQQACGWASSKLQQGCSLWIGSVNNSVVPEIVVTENQETATVMYWGMCSEGTDTTSRVWVSGDNDAIDDSFNVTRLAQPSAGGRPTTLNVQKFISGLEGEKVSECETRYTREVMVGRMHSVGGSWGEMPEVVTLRVISEECESDEDDCDSWAPISYRSSNEYHGVTSIDIRIKNLAGRFGGTGLGAWNDVDIWAMPTDTIRWRACYYPGVQYTHETEAGSLNGGDKGYDEPLPTSECIHELWKVEYEPLYVKVNKVKEWENKYRMFGDAGEYNWSGERGDTAIQWHEVDKETAEGDAGETFTEYAETGTPVEATIALNFPVADFLGCKCEKRGTCKTPGWNSCYSRDDDNNCVGGWDYSDAYCQAYNWSFFTCSCCDGSPFASHDDQDPGPTDFTGHKNTYEKTLNDATVKFGPAEDHLSVSLQYNFVVSTAVTTNKSLVYSGAKDQIKVNSVTTTVGTRYNSITLADYATEVPGAVINLYAYVSASTGGLGGIGGTGDICAVLGGAAKQCLQVKTKGQELNAGGSLYGSTDTIWADLTYNAFDAAAGDYMCFASSVSPYSVSGETDMAGSDGMWVYSTPSCAIIAKRPSFQVWGGSLYSVGSIEATYNAKVNIYNAYKDNISSKWKQHGGSNIYFTPWVEESLILKNGTTKTVASGAASGLTNSNKAKVGTSTDFCNDRAALSFANYSGTIGTLCNGAGTVGASGIDSGIKNRDDLIRYWVGTTPGVNTSGGTSFNLGNPSSVGQAISSASGQTIRFAYASGGLSLHGTVPHGTTYLIKSDGTVTITSNLKYTNGYTQYAQIPKVVIYAEDVNIRCGVDEVDAIIITKPGGNVNTCSNASSDDNDPKRSRQLKVFGMVITDSITLGRSYGSAANQNGHKTDPYGVPADGAAAEVFDYDSSILMWSEYMAGSQETDTQQVVYQHELAPRY